MKSYDLLILGRDTPKGTFYMEDSIECWSQITISIYEHFKKIPGVYPHVVGIHHPRRDGYEYSILPKTDFILFVGLPETWDEIDFVKLREATEYKKIVSLFERGVPGADCSFTFKNAPAGARESVIIPLPIDKRFYTNEYKEPKTILLDHCTCYGNSSQETQEDCRVHRIEEWLEPLKDEYKIYRIIQDSEEKVSKVKPYVTLIHETGLLNYLSATDRIETYVAAHRESYGYMIIDMVARGIRVLSPPNCLPAFPDIKFPIYFDKDTFLEQLRKPVNNEYWDGLINKMTDYWDIANMIHEKLRSWL